MFLDEYFGEEDFIQELSKLKSVDILWVAPNSVSMITQYEELNGIEEFKDFELQHNMRNSNSIIEKVIYRAEKEEYYYIPLIPSVLLQFPTGHDEIQADTLEEAIEKWQSSSVEKDNLLVILPSDECIKTISDGYIIILNERIITRDINIGVYTSNSKFNISGNPVKFLKNSSGPRILITDRRMITGFEWSTVVVVVGDDVDKQILFQNEMEEHSCNSIMRCTTQLILVTKDKELP